MNRLIDIALGKMQQIGSGTYKYPDDDVFIVPRGNASRLYSMDLSIENTSTKAANLLKNDGSIVDCCIVVAMGGHYFIHDGEIIYDVAASKDKGFIVIEGATHGGTPCKSCIPDGQKYDGRYDNAVKNNFVYLARWISARF